MKIEIVPKKNKVLVREMDYGDVVKMNENICLVCYASSPSKKGLVSLGNPEKTWGCDVYEVEYLGRLQISQ